MFVDSVRWLNMQAQCCSISTATPSPIRQPSTWRATAASENIGNGDRSRRLSLPLPRDGSQAGDLGKKTKHPIPSVIPQIVGSSLFKLKKILTGKRLERREIQSPDHPSLLSPSRADVSFVIGNYADGGGSSHSPPRFPNNRFSRSLSTK